MLFNQIVSTTAAEFLKQFEQEVGLAEPFEGLFHFWAKDSVTVFKCEWRKHEKVIGGIAVANDKVCVFDTASHRQMSRTWARVMSAAIPSRLFINGEEVNAFYGAARPARNVVDEEIHSVLWGFYQGLYTPPKAELFRLHRRAMSLKRWSAADKLWFVIKQMCLVDHTLVGYEQSLTELRSLSTQDWRLAVDDGTVEWANTRILARRAQTEITELRTKAGDFDETA